MAMILLINKIAHPIVYLAVRSGADQLIDKRPNVRRVLSLLRTYH
jgi:hypothetical protein